MENPKEGNAVLNETFAGMEIAIPVKKYWFVVIFLCAWMGGWLIGEVAAIGSLTGFFGDENPASFFIIFWLFAWTVGGFFAFRMIIWLMLGKELIIFDRGTITLQKKGALFNKPLTYNLSDASNFRVVDDAINMQASAILRSNYILFKDTGTIWFTYGLKTIKCAAGIDIAESSHILNLLYEKKILTDKNFNEEELLKLKSRKTHLL